MFSVLSYEMSFEILLVPLDSKTISPLCHLKFIFRNENKESPAFKIPYFSLKPVIKEEARLIATIEQIDRAVGIVPRGAFVKTPLGSVHENRYFEGKF